MELEQNKKKAYSRSRANNRQYHGHTKEEWEAMPLEERMKYI